MAITLRTQGTATPSGTAVTAIDPAVPAGALPGDLSVLAVTMKPYSTTITTPTGWTKISEATNGTVAAGTDTGSTKIAVFARESAAVGPIGNLSLTGADTAVAIIHTFAVAPYRPWDVSVFTSGGDTVNDANFSATGDAGLSVATGDVVFAAAAINGDLGSTSAITVGGMSGATIGTAVLAAVSSSTSTGTDCRLNTIGVPITAGTSSAAPTLTYTNSSSSSGTVMWLRLREGTLPVTGVIAGSLQTDVALTPIPPDIRAGSMQGDVAYQPVPPELRMGALQVDVAYQLGVTAARVGSVQLDAAYAPLPPIMRVGSVQMDVAYVYGGPPAPSGPTVTVWIGTAEVAATLAVWNGTAEVPASVSEVVL